MGYPRGLKGDEINWKSRILAVAESFDAMVHVQPYQAAMSRSEAIAELRNHSGTQFDAAIVEMFIEKILVMLPNSF